MAFAVRPQGGRGVCARRGSAHGLAAGDRLTASGGLVARLGVWRRIDFDYDLICRQDQSRTIACCAPATLCCRDSPYQLPAGDVGCRYREGNHPMRSQASADLRRRSAASLCRDRYPDAVCLEHRCRHLGDVLRMPAAGLIRRGRSKSEARGAWQFPVPGLYWIVNRPAIPIPTWCNKRGLGTGAIGVVSNTDDLGQRPKLLDRDWRISGNRRWKGP